ncbi:LamG domain-containing protein [Geofilum rubicundum]|uniref:LamG domain protein jellyroll fold domain protein n=1 Tax=Geofilum rubicundum JCM 15548 TaxID=1236989 RepID=A0A0E9M1H0_9BACT|nr:LamG domain-containing protein [Geofilum rubicundum]GAO31647.1 LamG domain protein jellyroll fold domain protein [Geofilum rubicundum JCM 15548]
MKIFIAGILIITNITVLFAQTATISNIRVTALRDGSGMVEVQYDLEGQNAYNLSLEVSFDDSNTFTPIPAAHLSGDVLQQTSGTNKLLLWNGLASFPDAYSKESSLKVIVIQTMLKGNLIDGLVSYWNLNGNLNDAHNTNHGNAASGVTSLKAEGVINQCPYFNGSSNAYITFGNDQSLNITGTAITMSAWVYNEKTTGLADIISKGRDYTSNYGYHLRWYNNPQSLNAIYRLTNGTNNTVRITGLKNETWYHIASTFDGIYGKLYLNGQLVSVTEQHGSIGNAITQFVIGAHSAGPSGWGYQWKGKIDEVAVWNRVLSEAEVQLLYNDSNGLSYPF